MLSVATCRRIHRAPRRVGQADESAIGTANVEGRPRPLGRLHPDAATVLLDDVAGDGQARGRSRRPRRGPAPGPPCRSARRSGPGRPAGSRPHGRPPSMTTLPSRTVTATVTSPPSGLNLTALWRRLTRTWPRRAASPRTGGRPAGTSTRSATPWRSANRRSRSVDSVASRPRSTPSTTRDRAAALDPRQVEQLADHLDEVAGLDLDLADPIAHLGRDGVADLVGLAVQRLGQEADRRQRRSQLVGQVVDELGPDPLEPAELGDILEDQPGATGRRAPRPDQQAAAVGVGAAELADRAPLLDRRPGDLLSLDVEEHLDQGPADEAAHRPGEERVGGAVGGDDPHLGIDRQDALGEGLDQQLVVEPVRGEVGLEPLVSARAGPQPPGPDRCPAPRRRPRGRGRPSAGREPRAPRRRG